MNETVMLEAINLCCRRDERTLFNQLSFIIGSGDLVQIEGANGAGKTSLLRLLTGLSRPDAGEVRWRNRSLSADLTLWHQQLLYLGHLTGLKSTLTVLENLRFYHPGASDHQILDALDEVELTGYESVALAQLSAGQQRRVALARLWLTQATFWILDEPLTAIDKSGIKTVINKFVQHARQGGTVILTTHQELPAMSYPLSKIRLITGELS